MVKAAPPPPAVKAEPPAQLPPKDREATAVATAAPPPPAVKVEPPPQPVVASKAPIVTTELPAQKPILLKLQGILYRPADPTAIINGKTVRIGDRIGEALVVSINQEGVAVAAAGQTNVLMMPR